MPACQRNCRASVSICAPVVPSGNTARAIAIWPRSTRVKRSRISSVGSPIAMVRVTSVVPSSYCAPESISSRSPGTMRRLLLRVTRAWASAPLRAGDAVVDDGAVRSGARDGRKGDVLQHAGVAAEGFQRLDGVDLGQRALRRL